MQYIADNKEIFCNNRLRLGLSSAPELIANDELSKQRLKKDCFQENFQEIG